MSDRSQYSEFDVTNLAKPPRVLTGAEKIAAQHGERDYSFVDSELGVAGVEINGRQKGPERGSRKQEDRMHRGLLRGFGCLSDNQRLNVVGRAVARMCLEAQAANATRVQAQAKDPFSEIRPDGATLLVNIQVGRQLYTVNLGDSTVFHVRREWDEARLINSKMHDSDRSNGGCNAADGRGHVSIAVNRSVGDDHLWEGEGHDASKLHNPDVYITTLEAGDIVLMACDGLTESDPGNEHRGGDRVPKPAAVTPGLLARLAGTAFDGLKSCIEELVATAYGEQIETGVVARQSDFVPGHNHKSRDNISVMARRVTRESLEKTGDCIYQGLFDGHGGKHTAQLCQDRFQVILQEQTDYALEDNLNEAPLTVTNDDRILELDYTAYAGQLPALPPAPMHDDAAPGDEGDNAEDNLKKESGSDDEGLLPVAVSKVKPMSSTGGAWGRAAVFVGGAFLVGIGFAIPLTFLLAPHLVVTLAAAAATVKVAAFLGISALKLAHGIVIASSLVAAVSGFMMNIGVTAYAIRHRGVADSDCHLMASQIGHGLHSVLPCVPCCQPEGKGTYASVPSAPHSQPIS